MESCRLGIDLPAAGCSCGDATAAAAGNPSRCGAVGKSEHARLSRRVARAAERGWTEVIARGPRRSGACRTTESGSSGRDLAAWRMRARSSAEAHRRAWTGNAARAKPRVSHKALCGSRCRACRIKSYTAPASALCCTSWQEALLASRRGQGTFGHMSPFPNASRHSGGAPWRRNVLSWRGRCVRSGFLSGAPTLDRTC